MLAPQAGPNERKSELLPAGWHADKELYTLRYQAQDDSQELLLKAIMVDTSMILNVMVSPRRGGARGPPSCPGSSIPDATGGRRAPGTQLPWQLGCAGGERAVAPAPIRWQLTRPFLALAQDRSSLQVADVTLNVADYVDPEHLDDFHM